MLLYPWTIMTRNKQIEAWIGEAVEQLPTAGARPIALDPRRNPPQPLEAFAEGTVPDGRRPGQLFERGLRR